MIVREEEERKESTEEEAGDTAEDSSHLGPKSSMSLLDQHSKLKEEARGWSNNNNNNLHGALPFCGQSRAIFFRFAPA